MHTACQSRSPLLVAAFLSPSPFTVGTFADAVGRACRAVRGGLPHPGGDRVVRERRPSRRAEDGSAARPRGARRDAAKQIGRGDSLAERPEEEGDAPVAARPFQRGPVADEGLLDLRAPVSYTHL